MRNEKTTCEFFARCKCAPGHTGLETMRKTARAARETELEILKNEIFALLTANK